VEHRGQLDRAQAGREMAARVLDDLDDFRSKRVHDLLEALWGEEAQVCRGFDLV